MIVLLLSLPAEAAARILIDVPAFQEAMLQLGFVVDSVQIAEPYLELGPCLDEEEFMEAQRQSIQDQFDDMVDDDS